MDDDSPDVVYKSEINPDTLYLAKIKDSETIVIFTGDQKEQIFASKQVEIEDEDRTIIIELDLNDLEVYYAYEENQPCLVEEINKIKNKHDIITLDELPEDGCDLTVGMCGGCISVTFVLENDRIIRGHFYSEDYNDEAFVRDFYEQIQELLNADISEIRIYAPINTDVLKNQVTAARGTLSSLNMLRKLGFPLDKVVFIEGQGSVYKFSKDVRGTKLVAVREKTPELLILITDVCEIEKSMNNVIQKGGLTHDEIMSKYEASRSGDTVIAPLKENLLEQTVNPVIWELANKAVERYLKNGKDKQDDPLKNIPGNISGGYSGVTQYRKAVKHILSKLGI
jgi:hypothetical protein